MRVLQRQQWESLRLNTMLLLLLTLYATACVTSGGTASRDPRGEQNIKRQVSAVEGLERVGGVPEADSPLGIQCVDEQLCWLQDGKRLWRSAGGAGEWQLVHSEGEDREPVRYSFIDSRVGWGVSREGAFRTADGGQTWSRMPTPADHPGGEIRSMVFDKDGKTGWLAGGVYRALNAEESKSGVPNNLLDGSRTRVLETAIFRSDDAGRTWHRQRLTPGGVGRIYSVKFSDGARGLALGDVIYYTDDGGKEWKLPRFNKGCVREEYLDEYYEASPEAVYMLNAEVWWVSYSDGRLIKSDDGGRSWCDLLHPGGVGFAKEGRKFFTFISFTNPQTGWALGWDRFLYRTRDGGLSWDRVTSDVKFDSLHFSNGEYGVAVSKDGLFRIRAFKG